MHARSQAFGRVRAVEIGQPDEDSLPRPVLQFPCSIKGVKKSTEITSASSTSCSAKAGNARRGSCACESPVEDRRPGRLAPASVPAHDAAKSAEWNG